MMKGSSFKMNIMDFLIFSRKQLLSDHDPSLKTNMEAMCKGQKCMCVCVCIYEIPHNSQIVQITQIKIQIVNIANAICYMYI